MSRSDLEKFRLEKGDLLVCEGGEIGRAAIWDAPIEECYYQKALHRLRPIRDFDPRLMVDILRQWSQRGALANYVTQTSIAHLPREKFIHVPIPLPRPVEQRAIAAALSDVDALLGRLNRLIAKKRDLKKAAMQQLRAVQSNDLLITITGNVGRVVRVPGDFGEANINQHIARIRIVDGATHPGWVYHFLSQSGVRQHFEKITTGQAYPQISLVQVRDAVIPRPTIAEQREISAALDDMDAEIIVLEARLEKTRNLKQAMMQALLTGKMRLVPVEATHV
jgi:type I restriction enzyme S subunit